MRLSGEAGAPGTGPNSGPASPVRPLTRREQEVAALIAQGLTNRQIARTLFISERTAEYDVEQIRNKLGFHARSQIAAWTVAERHAITSGEVTDSPNGVRSALAADMRVIAIPDPDSPSIRTCTNASARH